MDILKAFVKLDRSPTDEDRAASRPRGPGSTIMVTRDVVEQMPLDLRARTPWLRMWSRLLAPALDRRLAAGAPPESRPLFAARAEWLVSGEARQALARNWQDLVDQALAPVQPLDPRAPLCRDRVIAARGAVRWMVHVLTADAPVPARGVAMASWLLSDGTGPVYNPKCVADLTSVLRDVTLRLDPGVSLAAGSV